MRDPESAGAAVILDRFARLMVPLALVWVLFHLFGAGLGFVGARELRTTHLAGAVILVLAWRPLPGRLRAIDFVLVAVAATAASYLLILSDRIVLANWFVNEGIEKALGIGLFIALIEAIRRALGWMFVGLIAAFLLYAVCGPWIPGVMGHRGVGADRLIYSFYIGNQGVFGSLVGISASVVALFLIFGELLNASGAGNTFINIAMRIGGRLKGGAGMVAVIGSAFMGMVNGSAVANVTSTGVLTIPLMRRLGFNRNLAGAIEAVASTGGQFMPPIMGPGAFLMAELLGISYLQVATAAFIPSTLFFVGLLFAVWLFADKHGLQPIPEEMIPPRSVAYAPIALTVLIMPIGILVGFVVAHFTVQYAVFWATLAAAAFFVLQKLLDRPAPSQPGAEGPAQGEPEALLPTLRRAGLRATETIAYVAMIITAAQLIVGVINLTGLGVTLSQVIVALGQGDATLSLVLTMAVAILLGMGMPTPAAYAVAAAVLGPPLARLGYDPLPAHLFIYYFACLAAITPPVAAAVFAATAISRGQVLPTAGYALLLALSLFLIPYLFVDDPVLLMSGEVWRIVLSGVTAALGVALLSLATIGHFHGSIHPLARVGLALAALGMIVPGALSDIVGFCVAAALMYLHLRRQPQSGRGIYGGRPGSVAPAADDAGRGS